MDRKPEVIIFDVGDTLISLTGYNRERGVRRLLGEATFAGEVDVAEMVGFGEALDRELEARCGAKNLEYSQRSFHKLLYGSYGIRFDRSEAELELLYWNEALVFAAEPGAREALARTKELGYRLAIISNTTFSAEVISHELEKHGMREQFELVVSSADLGIRKPDERIFRTARGLLDADARSCWYVGNSAYFDVHGSASAGMQPVWYNRLGQSGEVPSGTLEITHWKEFAALLEDDGG